MKWFAHSIFIILLCRANICQAQIEQDPHYAPDSILTHGIYIDSIGEVPWGATFSDFYNQYKDKGLHKVNTRKGFYYLKMDSVTVFKTIRVSINIMGSQKFSLRRQNPDNNRLRTVEILFNNRDFERLRSIVDYYAKTLNTYYTSHFPNVYIINGSRLLFFKGHKKPEYSLYLQQR